MLLRLSDQRVSEAGKLCGGKGPLKGRCAAESRYSEGSRKKTVALREAGHVLKKLGMILVGGCFVIASAIQVSSIRQAGEAATAGEQTTAGAPQVIDSRSDQWAVVPEAAAAPQLDGVLNEAMWETAVRLNGFASMYHNEPIASDTEVMLAYDAQHLYIGIVGSSEDGSMPETERLDVVLSTAASSGSYYKIPLVISPGPRTILTEWGAGGRTLSQAVYEVSKQTGSWTAEIKVPLASIASEGVLPGDEWRLNVLRYYGVAAPKPFSSLVPIRSSDINDYGAFNRDFYVVRSLFYGEGRLASLYFGELPQQSGATAVERWIPEEAGLLYTGYTQKRLTLPASEPIDWESLELIWRTPSNKRLPVVDMQIDAANGRVDFTHPFPLETGMYQLEIMAHAGGGGQTVQKKALLMFDSEAMIRAGEAMQPHSLPPNGDIRVEAAPPSQKVAQLLTIIPEQAGILFGADPERPELRPDMGHFTWSIQDPFALVSKSSGRRYPNEQFPEDQSFTVTNRKGETVVYPYYEDAEGKRYLITPHLWYVQKEYALEQTKLVALTDPLGAARLLNRWADVYEGWVPTNDYPWGSFPTEVNTGPPYHWWGGMWYRWSTADLMRLKPLAEAYAAIKRTDAFDVLSAELGFDVESKVVEGLFHSSYEFFNSFTNLNHNMDYNNWIGLTALARALQDPRYMHQAVERTGLFVANQFLADGFFKEVSVSYHNQSTSGLRETIEAAKGWTDPEGYLSPRTGRRLSQLDLAADYPALRKSMEIDEFITYPNGKYLPIQDTWAHQRSANPRIAEGSLFLPATGIARLTRGLDAGQHQLYMSYVPKYGHDHADPLSLALYANGQELLPDIGYTHTFYRRWTSSTMAHNTVVVDGADASRSAGAHGGSLRLFAPLGRAVQVMQASQENAYPGVGTYNREPWFIGFEGASGNEGYVVDLFRVAGGSRHEYTLNGDANREMVVEADATLTDYGPYLLPEGVQVTMPTTELETGDAEGEYYGYIYVQDVRKAELTDGRYEATFRAADGEPNKTALKVIGYSGDGQSELYVGRSPSLRATRLHGTSRDTNLEAVNYTLPKLVVRKEGSQLNSTFIHVMEPYQEPNAPRIGQVERLQPEQGGEGAVALAVTYGNTTDILLSSPAGEEQPLVVGDIWMNGRLGFIRIVDNEIRDMRLVGGSLLRKGETELYGAGTIEGTVSGVLRTAEGAPYNALTTASFVPEDAIGSTVIVTHPDNSSRGFVIQQVLRTEGETHLLIEDTDPGFSLYGDGSSGMTSYPFKSWNGPNQFRIEGWSGFTGAAPSFESADGSPLDTLAAGSPLQAAAEISNDSSAPMPVTLIVALKNSAHETEAVAYAEQTVAAGQRETLAAGLRLPEQLNGHYVEAYLWNSPDRMRPLAKSTILTKRSP